MLPDEYPDRPADETSDKKTRERRPAIPVAPRCLDREQAAVYIGSSEDTIDRLINAGILPIVRMPVQRSRKTGKGIAGINRRVLIDVRDLDSLIDRAKERRT